MDVIDPQFRYLIAFSMSLIGALVLTPYAGKLATRVGIVDRPSENRFHLTATPYLGGVAVAAAFFAGALVISGAPTKLLAGLFAASAVCLIGLIDDRRTVSPQVKLIVEAAAAASLWIVGIRADVFGVYILDLAITVLWIVAITNAFNMLDNMDGLTAGVTTISSLALFGIAAHHGDYVVATFCLALAGASLGFLRYNFPPAKIFLGDAGSLLVGFLVAAFALESQAVGENGLPWILVPLMIVAVPSIDATFVVISRVRAGKPFYVGGTDHTSHRLADLGLTPMNVAVVFYVVQATFCAIAVWLVLDGSLAPLVAAPFILATVATALWFLAIVPRLEQRSTEPIIDLDVIDLTTNSPAAATQPVLYDGKRRA